jgi:site-specific recombinase XerD
VPDAVAAFVRDVGVTKKPATIARYLASLAHLHRAADLPSPTGDNVVRLALRSLRRNKPTRQRQATGLNAAVLERLAVALTGSPRDLRDVAMLRLARDMLARRSELVALDITDLERADDGSATVIIRRSKTDQDGAGTVQFVSPDTVAALDAYTAAVGIEGAGPLFRSIRKDGVAGGRLSTRSVADAFKRLAEAAGLDAEAVSGHSARVGMAQDLTRQGASLPELMQAGRWQSPAMPARYAERQAAAHGAVAKFYGAT